jgi:transposase
VEDEDARLIDVSVVAVGPAKPAPPPVGRNKTFRKYDPDQVVLLPGSVRDLVPDDDQAHFIADLVDQEILDLSRIFASYKNGRGFPPYDPRLMVKLLLYGYSHGITSSRKLEQATHRDVAMRMLCAGQHPDHRAIGRFRTRHLKALAGFLVQSIRLCDKAGMVGLGTLAVDGTKLRANASRRKAMSYERMGPRIDQLQAEVDALLQETERIDREEDELYGKGRKGIDLPGELARRETRIKKIKEAQQALEDETREAEQTRRDEMIAEGRSPKDPEKMDRDPFVPRGRAQRNFTDPESRIMKTADGSFHQCYNGQAIVDSEHQIILATGLDNVAPDHGYLPGTLARLDENLQAIGHKPQSTGTLLADAGYYSDDHIGLINNHGLDPVIATGRLKHHERAAPAPRGRIPNDATTRERMARKLKTKKGREAYARRKAIVEPVFGQIETVQNGRKLRIRGKQAAAHQWDLACAIHNLWKLHRAGGLTLLQGT